MKSQWELATKAYLQILFGEDLDLDAQSLSQVLSFTQWICPVSFPPARCGRKATVFFCPISQALQMLQFTSVKYTFFPSEQNSL